jgi:hypothetical protein
MTHPVLRGGPADLFKNPEMFLFKRELTLIPFSQDIPSLIGHPSHRVAIVIQHPIQPAKLADVEMPKLQASDLFQLLEKGVKLVTSILLCIAPVEGDARGIITYLTFRAGRLLE